jgi:hypothetical protein
MRQIWLMVALIFVVVLAVVGGIVFLFAKLLERLIQ